MAFNSAEINEFSDIWVFCEQREGKLMNTDFELISEGRKLADERGEVAAMYNGQPQLEVGRRTDVTEGCPKDQGLMLLLRAMNPQVLAVDEITAPEDVRALSAAVGCGVTLLASAHGEGRAGLECRALYRPLLEEGMFRFLVRIHREGERRVYTVEELN